MDSVAFSSLTDSPLDAVPESSATLGEGVTAEGGHGVPLSTGNPALIWRVGLAASVLLHGAAICSVLFGLVRLSPSDNPVGPVMTVEIAPAVAAPPITPHETPPGPQRIETVAAVQPHLIDPPKTPPPPRILIRIKADVAMPVKPDPQPKPPAPKPVEDQTTAPQAIIAPAKSEQTAPTPGASEIASDAPQTWESSLLATLQHNKRYPKAAQSDHEEDVVYVRLVIDGTGRLTEAQVVRSRGYALLDQEVISLAHRSSPYPAPPAKEGDPAIVVVPVEFFITRHGGG